MLPVILGTCRPDKAKIQRWYIERQQYDFVIDDGTNMIKLTEEIDIWSRLQPGTRIIMRVITEEKADSMLTATYKCRCGTLNIVHCNSEHLVVALRNGCIITW